MFLSDLKIIIRFGRHVYYEESVKPIDFGGQNSKS